MSASFAAYASQLLTRQQHPASSMASTSHPLFYSFTSDDSQLGDASSEHEDIELDDDDDPHLGRTSDYSRIHRNITPDDDDDPYLRLDEEDPALARTTRQKEDGIPLVSSKTVSKAAAKTSSQGWLAHQASQSYRAASRAPSDSSSDSGVSPSELLSAATQNAPRPSRARQAEALTESLLPRDGVNQPVFVFSLPDPRLSHHGRIVRKDRNWAVTWLGSVAACTLGSIIILFTTSTRGIPRGTIVPYTVLLHSIPLLTILTFLSAIVSYAHIMLLKTFVKPVIFATSVFIPATLFISAIWAFVGSFMWEEGAEPTWGETVGLRLFSLVPLALALVTSRRLFHLRDDINTASSVLTLSTSLLISNPFLLALSPLILLLALLCSLPFLTLSFRLLLIGYATTTANSAWEWHVKNWASWSITGTIFVWLWSWGVARGILRTTCAAVIGAWYFTPQSDKVPPPFDTYRIHCALYRATNSSLGSIALSALLLTVVRVIALLGAGMRRLPVPLLPWLALPLRVAGNISGALSTLALAYAGLSGEAFFQSARRARTLTAAVTASSGRVKYRASGLDPTLAILSITPLTLTLPFALSTYLFVAHTLGAPGYAAMAALLAGGVTALVGMFCVGLVEDTADTLYMCYCIDKEIGEMHKEHVFSIMEWNTPKRHPVLTEVVTHEQQTSGPHDRAPRSSSPEALLGADNFDPSLRISMNERQSADGANDPPTKAPPLEESRSDMGSTILGLDYV